MPKILLLSSALPYPGVGSGGGTRVLNLITRLRGEHELTLLSYRTPEEADKVRLLEPLCRVETVSTAEMADVFPKTPWAKAAHLVFPRWTDDALRCRSEAFRRKLAEVLARDSFDAFIVGFPEMGLFKLDLPEGPLAIYDSHEARSVNLARLAAAESRPLKKLYLLSQTRKMRAYERWLCRAYDAVLALTAKDESYFRSISTRARVVRVPTGPDLSKFPPRRSSGTPGEIVYVGFYGNVSNVDAVERFARGIFPSVRARVPGAAFKIVGSNVPERVRGLESEPGVAVEGFAPDLAARLSRAAVFAAPIALGGGIRGKLLEALAVGVPVVASSIAVEGLGLVPGRDALIADEPGAFADAVASVLSEPAKAAALSAAGRRFVEEHYDWDKNVLPLKALLCAPRALELERLDACPLCGGRSFEPWAEIGDHRRLLPGRFRLARCAACSLVFQNPRPAPASMPRLYPPDYGPYSDDARANVRYFNRGESALARWKNAVKRDILAVALGYPEPEPVPAGRRLLARALAPSALAVQYRVPRWHPGGRVLEIGSSRGFFLDVLRELGWKPTGLEWDGALARRTGAELGIPVLEGLDALKTAPEGSFDAVVSYHVLEHLPDPVAALREMRRVLAPGGRLRLVVPNTGSLSARILREHWTALAEPRHFFHFDPRTAGLALEKAGWRGARVRTVASRGVWGSGLRWRDEDLRGAAEERPWYERPAAARLFGAVSWAGNLLGLGDYLLIEAEK